MAMAQLADLRSDGGFTYSRTLAGRSTDFTSESAVYREKLGVPDAGAPLVVRNTSRGVLFATVTTRGTPAAGAEDQSSAGLAINVSYSDASGRAVDVSRLAQGEDVTVDIVLTNTTREPIRHIALTQIVPSGWEIANERLHDADEETGDRDARSRSEEYRNQSQARTDYVDIRDDRVMQFFDLGAGTTIRFQTRVNAAYRGRFYLPGIVAEAMYDAATHARTAGRWTEVLAR